ncbi:MAG: histidine phosphatase family protein [Kineosporiaceae bacterium]
MSAARLVLLRHGRTASNAENRFQGHLDVELDDVGLAQAAVAAAYLGERLADAAARGAVRVVSSDLSRARQTAEPLAKALGVDLELDDALRERDGGAWQGLLRDEIQSRFPDEYGRWMAGEDLIIGGGESLGQCWVRCEGGIRRHVEAMTGEADGGTLVVVSHGASMRGAMLRLLGLIGRGSSAEEVARDLALYRTFDGFGNAHWAELGVRRSGWVLERFNVSAPDAPAS